MREGLRIGELAARCGVSTRTIDYYTRLGLLRPSVRTDGNYRLYEPEAMSRLVRIKQLQERRLSLQEIRERLDGDEGSLLLVTLQEVQRDLDAIRSKLAVVDGSVDTHDLGHAEPALTATLRCAQSIAQRLEALVGWNDGRDDAAMTVRT